VMPRFWIFELALETGRLIVLVVFILGLRVRRGAWV
jgi:hypothetical protein